MKRLSWLLLPFGLLVSITTVAFAYEDGSASLVKRGKFYCTSDGKIVLSRGSAMDGDSSVLCITANGDTYNAISGGLISSVSQKSFSKRKSTLVINNYLGNSKKKESKVWKKGSSINYRRPFSGFYLGARFGFGLGRVTETYMADTGNAYVPYPGVNGVDFLSNTLTQSFGTARIHIIGGGNLQLGNRFLLGVEIGGAIMSFDQFAFLADDTGQPLPYYLQSSRGVIDAQVRAGVVFADQILLYLGVGVDSYLLQESRNAVSTVAGISGTSFSVVSSANFSIAPRFSVGFDWLIAGHIGFRVEYAVTYMPEHSTTIFLPDVISQGTTGTNFNRYTLDYDFLRHTFSGSVYYKF